MSIPYPQALAGKDTNDISVNATLDILKSVEVWRGGTGDGTKEKLTTAMNSAIQAHKKYCEMELPGGWVRDHALKSGAFTQQFWLSLASYVEDEIILLQTFKLPEKKVSAFSCLIKSFRFWTTWQNFEPTPRTSVSTALRLGLVMHGFPCRHSNACRVICRQSFAVIKGSTQRL